MGITVENGGILTTVQDEGRFGNQAFGVSTSGAMDPRAFHIANLLVGNKKTEGALEMTFIGPTLTFTSDNIIAVTGGDLTPMLDGQPFPMYKAVLVKKGQKLMFAGARNGSRGYIAFAGGLDIPLVMGSKSTLLRNHIGGVEGRKLEKGDTIEFTAPKTELPNMELRQVPAEIYPSDEVVLRVVLGPQENEFTEEGVRKFFWYSGTITNEFDRMGCRIEREPVEHAGDGNINTDGISMGSIQVPLNGQPIIMLADRQSTGGYPKIGTVITVDFAKIAQARPGQKIRFIEVSLELAQDLYIRELKNPIYRLSVFLVNLRSQIQRYSIFLQKNHGPAHICLFCHLFGDLQCLLLTDAFNLRQPLRFFLHNPHSIIPEASHDPCRKCRTNSLDCSGSQISLHCQRIFRHFFCIGGNLKLLAIYRMGDIISRRLNGRSLRNCRKCSHTGKLLFLFHPLQHHNRISIIIIPENHMIYISCNCFAHFLLLYKQKALLLQRLNLYILDMISAYFPVPAATTSMASCTVSVLTPVFCSISASMP